MGAGGDRPPLVFCATGIEGIAGGIANANRNVHAALRRLGDETGAPVEVLALLEDGAASEGFRGFGGRRAAFAGAVLSALVRGRLVVFDHVRLAVPALVLPRARRAPVVVCAHGSEVGRRVRPLSRRVLAGADLVLANSGHTLRNMRRALGREVGIACPLGLPPQFALRPAPPGPAEVARAREGLSLPAADGTTRPIGGRMLLLVGRLDAGEREKGHRELIEAMPQVLARAADAQLVFVGAGSDEAEIRRIAAASPAAGAIFVAGHAPHELLERLYLGCFAYAMPSRQEGFGLVYLEAMNAAKPCIACRDDGGGEVVLDGRTGYLVDQPVDPAALAGTVVRLLGDEEGARRMGLAGWERLRESFTAEAHQLRLMEHLRPLIDARGPSRAGWPAGGRWRGASAGTGRP